MANKLKIYTNNEPSVIQKIENYLLALQEKGVLEKVNHNSEYNDLEEYLLHDNIIQKYKNKKQFNPLLPFEVFRAKIIDKKEFDKLMKGFNKNFNKKGKILEKIVSKE
jgi:hypothetical protein